MNYNINCIIDSKSRLTVNVSLLNFLPQLLLNPNFILTDMKEEIKKGNDVRLKTGGPVMTVKEIKDDLAHCEWLVVDKLVSMSFKINNLVLIPVNATN